MAQAADAEGGLDEIVVTAQKKSENLQNVPISIEVLDSEKLDKLHIVNLDDYVKYSPSVAYVRGEGQGGNGQPGSSHVYIRGVVSGGTNHSGSQPSVGTYHSHWPDLLTAEHTFGQKVFGDSRMRPHQFVSRHERVTAGVGRRGNLYTLVISPGRNG